MNGLGLNDLKPGAVAVTTDGRVAVIVRHDLNRPRRPICLKIKADGPVYISAVDGFRAVVGQVDLAQFEKASTPIPPPVLTERLPMWSVGGVLPNNIKELGLKVGDLIRVRHGRRVVTATFQGFNWSRPKYPVSYNINGKQWKGPVDVIVGKALFGAAKVEAPEIKDIRIDLDADEDRINRTEALVS